MIKPNSIFLLGILLQGCSSIEQPVASRALVEYEFGNGAVVLPLNQQLVLSQADDDKSVQLGNKKAELGPIFFAASGKNCRKVKFIKGGQRVYCKTRAGDWYAVNPVLATYSEVAIGGNQ
ncbi:hypothetical protein [Paraglaciecola marina]|uniref:hypothetical protein n=1 Tax=Paraglaciecola marina TaxID=2500157 RepID=UPI00105DA9D8|nr:hypothetical protein [Paraglaciecola marina]